MMVQRREYAVDMVAGTTGTKQRELTWNDVTI